MKLKHVLGIDVGGSGIKGAPVDVKQGVLLEERYRLTTPKVATPEAVAGTVKKIVDHFNWTGNVGIGFPAVVLNGIVQTASNIDNSWIGVNAHELFTYETGLKLKVVNDADAAGMAEKKFGVGKKCRGTVLLLTIGTGIGSVLFSKKKLVANTELGHIYLPNGQLAEKYTADSVREKEGLSWEEWGKRFNEYLLELERIMRPELIVIGGGVSKRSEKFIKQINIETPLKMASLRNEAGIIGAALAGCF